MRLIDADALLDAIAAETPIHTKSFIRILDLVTTAPTVQVDILNITKVLEGYKAPEPLPVIPLMHEQLNTPFGTGRTVQREGWVSVPMEPTQDMCQQGQWKANEWKQFPLRITSIYKAMIQAAPTDKE